MKNQNKTVLLALMLLASVFSFAQTPIYNSYPSAAATIFLDFDGQAISGTSWNTSTNAIVCGPSNLNAAQITEVFNRVAEDYRPFNINITTDSTKYWAAPATQRMRIILTITSDWYGAAGGVSYTNSFVWGDNTPAFVFTALLNYNIKNISEAASHEAGHTLGLRHQSLYDANCSKTTDYNSGVGDGEIGWAPIMGVGYYKNFTVWHNGTSSAGCTAIQSDLEIISSTRNGFGYRTDDHASKFTDATAASFVNNQFVVSGVISETTDQDLFKFKLNSNSRFVLDGIPYNVGTGNTGSDLDMQVELIDSKQNVVGTYNPGNELSSIIDTSLTSGTYYLRIDGKGNQYASEYGSLGSYSLQADLGTNKPLPLHQLELKGTTEAKNHKLTWFIDADETVVSQVLEASSDGRNFSPLATPNTSTRTYTYLPSSANALQYRVAVTFDNGRTYYSNVIALRNTGFAKPQLLTNVLQANELMVSSSANYSYVITDYTGKMVSKGQVAQGSSSINAGFLTKGFYIIQFKNGGEQYLEKFTKQ